MSELKASELTNVWGDLTRTGLERILAELNRLEAENKLLRGRIALLEAADDWRAVADEAGFALLEASQYKTAPRDGGR